MKTGFHHCVIEAQINSPSSNLPRELCFRSNICIEPKLLIKNRKLFANHHANRFRQLCGFAPADANLSLMFLLAFIKPLAVFFLLLCS